MQMVLPWKWSAGTSAVHCAMIFLFYAGRQFKQRPPVHVCLPFPFPRLPAYYRGVQLLSILHCTPGACCILMQAIKVTNLGGQDTEQTSIDGNRARHGLADCTAQHRSTLLAVMRYCAGIVVCQRIVTLDAHVWHLALYPTHTSSSAYGQTSTS